MMHHKEKPGFISTLIIAAVVGTIVGVFDLWAFEFSVKSFYGGVAAGVTLFVSFSAINYFIPQGFNIIQRFSWYFSGGLAGFVWWVVLRPPSIQMWMAIVGGIIITIVWWFAESAVTKEKPSIS